MFFFFKLIGGDQPKVVFPLNFGTGGWLVQVDGFTRHLLFSPTILLQKQCQKKKLVFQGPDPFR